MVSFITLLVLVLVANAVLLALLSHQFAPRTPRTQVEGECVENYEPMMRLLSRDELAVLRNHPGYTRQMETQFRAERSRLFRGYLRSLEADFDRTCKTIKLIMVQSQTDRRDLASLLVRSQVSFGWGVAVLQVKVALYSWGVGTVDATALFRPFYEVRKALEMLMPQDLALGNLA
jgi:hypothetical protein